MSRKAAASAHKTDPRVRRTEDSLGDALVELMHEKPFEEITVQNVLDRAGVGRSTFYTHFRDKDDLFMNDVDNFFEHMSTMLSRTGEASSRVAPVREIFAHVGESKVFYSALKASGKIHDVMDLGQAHFARGIERRLAELAPDRSGTAASRPVMAFGFAGAMLALLEWWIDHGKPRTPEQMDETFQEMVWSGVSAPNGEDTSVKTARS